MASVGLSGAGRAERVDPVNGVREIAEFAGIHDPVLRFVHLPPTQPTGTLMICSPVYAEFSKNYRREVRLARKLASSGIAAVRLQYRGTGNSQGDAATATMASLASDVADTVADLSSRHHLPSPAYLGTRVGAIVAASAAPPTAPLVLWEPVLSGDRWLKEGIRAAAISRVSRHLHDEPENSKPENSKDPIAQLEKEGVLDLLGFALYQPLVADIRAIATEELLSRREGRLLVLQVGGGSQPRPAVGKLLDRLRLAGVNVDFQSAGKEVAWWYEEAGGRDFSNDDEIIDPTVSWLTQVFGNLS